MTDTTAGLVPTHWKASSSASCVGIVDTAGKWHPSLDRWAVFRAPVATMALPHTIERGIPLTLPEPPALMDAPPVERRAQRGEALLRGYARSFVQSFVPYGGPDEAPGFEPEDYPVR